jgi:phage shock protein PspC (stress-responsive transcriptional regulator)
MQVNRRLYRCRHDKRIAGVASGLAEYFDLDPSLIRVFWVLSIFVGGVGVFAYIAMAIIVPLEPEEGLMTAGPGTGDLPGDSASTQKTGSTVGAPTDWHSMAADHRHASRGTGRATTWFGIILMLFGALALVDAVLPAWADSGRFLWPAFILGIGALLVASGVRREPTGS